MVANILNISIRRKKEKTTVQSTQEIKYSG